MEVGSGAGAGLGSEVGSISDPWLGLELVTWLGYRSYACKLMVKKDMIIEGNIIILLNSNNIDIGVSCRLYQGGKLTLLLFLLSLNSNIIIIMLVGK